MLSCAVDDLFVSAHSGHAALRRQVILTLTPDFREQHLAAPLIELLGHFQFKIVAAVPAMISVAEMKRLYAGRTTYVRSVADQQLEFVSQRLFTLGPSIVLICRTTSIDDLDPQARLAQLKGRSDYDLRTPDALRALSPIADRAVSAFHCPDDLGGALFELEEHFEPGELALMTRPAPAMNRDAFTVIANCHDIRSERHPVDLVARLASVALAMAHSTALLFLQAENLRERSTVGLRQIPINLIGGVITEEWDQLAHLAAIFADLAALYGHEIQRRTASDRAVKLRQAMILAENLCARNGFTVRKAHAFADSLRSLSCPLSPLDEHRMAAMAAYHGGGL